MDRPASYVNDFFSKTTEADIINVYKSNICKEYIAITDYKTFRFNGTFFLLKQQFLIGMTISSGIILHNNMD
uniref:Uncharacterized protein n=1 Tax=Arundo donax TaxID=35708 RepID=A0A0A9BSB7_ARUDO